MLKPRLQHRNESGCAQWMRVDMDRSIQQLLREPVFQA
jgi:hypothetical protein